MKWHKVIIEHGGAEITIHDSSEADSDIRVLDGKITTAINSIGTFSFSIYPNNPGYHRLHGLRTKVTVLTDEGTLFVGRVLTVNDGMDSDGVVRKSVLCEDRLGWLCDTVQPYREWTISNGMYIALNAILTRHNNKVSDKKIRLGVCDINVSNNYHYLSNWETTLETISDKLIAHYGGEIQLRENNVLYLDYLERIGTATDTTIELAKNLKTITRDIDETAVITRLYPLGAKLENSEDRVQINYQGHNYIEDLGLTAQYGLQEATKIWDDVTVASNLLEKAQQYMATANKSKAQYKISALDLAQVGFEEFQAFKLGNTYRVKNPVMNLDETLRIIAITYSIDKPYESELTFGDKFETMSSFTANKSKALEQSITNDNVRSYSLMDSKIANATALITGAEGGYVIIDTNAQTGIPERILIMDTADINTCTSCIQLNKNGLGFWKASDGGSAKTGPYKNAWTIDGNLVASFITALTLTGQRINNGNGTFRVDADGTVVAKNLQIQGGSINVATSSQNYDYISLSYTNSNDDVWHSTLSPLELRLENSSIGGNTVFQAGATLWKWNNENKVTIDSTDGNIVTFTDNGKAVFYLDTNNRVLTMRDSNQKVRIRLNSSDGTISVYDSSGNRRIYLDCSGGYATFYDSSGNDTVLIDGDQGAVFAKHFIQT